MRAGIKPGLPGKRAWVWVGPPLLRSGPRSGLIGKAAVPTLSPLVPFATPVAPAPSPTRLNALAGSIAPSISSADERMTCPVLETVPSPLAATIELLTSTSIDAPARLAT